LRFDRDLPVGELLRAMPRARLEKTLTAALGGRWHVADADGARVLGPGAGEQPGAIAAPLRIDIETVGRLVANGAAQADADIAASWLETILASARRYQMTADLHLETVHADYEALQAKHAALEESEARYRKLCEELDERVRAQVKLIEQAQRQLYQAEKMASVGSLAAGMAHEINNPAGFIRSNLATAGKYVEKLRQAFEALGGGAEEVRRRFDIDFVLEDFSGLLSESIDGADRIARIVANLRSYASIDCEARQPLDLNEAVQAVAAILRGQLPANVSLELALRPLPAIAGDRSRINQALLSLAQNARQALGAAGGTIRISSGTAGGEIRIAVVDDGCGIAPDLLDRIFDPFFTTRDVGDGMGLGLTVSRDIAHAHRGRIEVASEVAAGSTFTLCLPAAEQAA
jgi:signal transduction histidine kinase